MKKMWIRVLVIAAAVVAGLFLRNVFFGEDVSKQATAEKPAVTQPVKPSQSASEASAKDEEKKKGLIVLAGRTMGTTYHISYFAEEIPNLTSIALQKEIDDYLVAFNKEFSTYDPNSVISTFNKKIEADTPFAVSADFAKLVEESKRIRELTDGYFDATVFPLVKAWGFGPGKATEGLTEEQIASIKAHIGMEKIDLVEEGGKYSLVKTDPEVTLDFSAIAKGYGVDKVAELLEARGAQNYIVEIGGEVNVKGKNIEKNIPWGIAIEQPKFDGTQSIQRIIEPQDMAVATSGTYRNFRFENGRRISHEIDPKSGYPIQHQTVSLTVVADNCMEADALATGLFVMGKDKALEIADKEDIAIYVIYLEDSQYKARGSRKFNKLFPTLKQN